MLDLEKEAGANELKGEAKIGASFKDMLTLLIILGL